MELSKKQLLTLISARTNFPLFVDKIFSASFSEFIRGQHVTDTAKYLQNNTWTCRVSAKDHFKSTSLYAHIMWRIMYGIMSKSVEAHYFSYQSSMADYHIKKLKGFIQCNPWFETIVDHKPTADTIMKYSWNIDPTKPTYYYTLEAHGLLAFKRGIHCDDVYVDDPLQDPRNVLKPTSILTINHTIKTQIFDMPRRHTGICHIAGTPQTPDDFFFDKDAMESFATSVKPAIIDDAKQKVLWKEYMDYAELMKRKKSRGEKIFNCEYQCHPIYTEDAWFKVKDLEPTLSDRDMLRELSTKNVVVLGWDLGKKRHPSHVAIFESVNGDANMVYEEFMDGWDYIKQIEHVNDLCSRFSVDIGGYDATRGELETAEEKGELADTLKPVIFKSKLKFDMATIFSKRVESRTISLLNRKRLLDQILCVTNDLQALETPMGHGDSFFSCCMALKALEDFESGEIDWDIR